MKLDSRKSPYVAAKSCPLYKLLAALWSDKHGIDIIKISRKARLVGAALKVIIAFFVLVMVLTIYLPLNSPSQLRVVTIGTIACSTFVALAIVFMMVRIESSVSDIRMIAEFQRALHTFNDELWSIDRGFSCWDKINIACWGDRSTLHEACVERMTSLARLILQSEANGLPTDEDRTRMANRSDALKPFGLADNWNAYFKQASRQLGGDDYVI